MTLSSNKWWMCQHWIWFRWPIVKLNVYICTEDWLKGGRSTEGIDAFNPDRPLFMQLSHRVFADGLYYFIESGQAGFDLVSTDTF